MFSRRILIGAIATGAAAAAVVAATPAMAAASQVAISAGSKTGTLAVSGTSTNIIKFTTSGGAVLQCPANVLLSGASQTGTGQSPNNVARITGSTWPSTGCTAGGVAANVFHGVYSAVPGTGVSPTSNTTWPLNVNNPSTPATGSTALAPVAGQSTPGTVASVGATVKTSSCTFTVTGSVGGTLKNSALSGQAATTSTLTLSSASLTVGNIISPAGATSCLFNQVVKGGAVTLNQSTDFATAVSGGGPLWANAK